MGQRARFYAASTRWGKGSKKPTKQDLYPPASKLTGRSQKRVQKGADGG